MATERGLQVLKPGFGAAFANTAEIIHRFAVMCPAVRLKGGDGVARKAVTVGAAPEALGGGTVLYGAGTANIPTLAAFALPIGQLGSGFSVFGEKELEMCGVALGDGHPGRALFAIQTAVGQHFQVEVHCLPPDSRL
jgi:hypothetical protein